MQQVVTGDVVEAAIKFADSIADKPVGPRRISSMAVPDASNAVQLREGSYCYCPFHMYFRKHSSNTYLGYYEKETSVTV